MPLFNDENEHMKAYPIHFRPKQVLLDAPLIKQFPELPRGCEVTSLAMLVQFAGYGVDKMELAKNIKKAPTPYQVIHGQVHFGNPNVGFVGAMDTYDEPGLGVYHGPVADLARSYMGDRVIDLTGDSFEAVLDQLADGIPVWVINNTRFTRLPEKFWETWQTPEGPIQITYKEHSVLVTGYDQNWIYFNDPLAGVKNRKMKRASFIEAWKQIGSQAISYRVKEE
ncbi:MAG TPA: C39 family peptidase [Bacillales bacterium]|nr:C39 family peptidase [Bacillales bacterium]